MAMKITSFRRKYKIAKHDFEQLIELGIPTIGDTQIDERSALKWLDSKSSRGRMIAKKSDIAKLLDVSLTTINNWERRHGHFPQLPAYEADIREFAASIRTKTDTNPELKVVGESPAEDRYRNAKAALAEITLQQKTGELVPLKGCST